MSEDEIKEKCGEIFILNRNDCSLQFVCTFCNTKFQNVVNFIDHLQRKHILADMMGKQPKATEESEDAGAQVSVSQTLDLDDSEYEHTEEHTEVVPVPDDSFFEESYKSFVETRRKFLYNPEVEQQILNTKLTKPKSCDLCGAKFIIARDIREHVCTNPLAELSANKLQCPDCQKTFKSKSILKIHRNVHLPTKPHQCEICDRGFNDRTNYVVHMRRHNGDLKHICEYCQKGFATSTEKISHVRTHTGQKPFVCEICGYAYRLQASLTDHLRTHTNSKDYKCEVCSKGFRNSWFLVAHMKSHTIQPKKYACEVCSAKFKTNRLLYQHRKIHDEIKRYVCEICNKAFAQKPGLYCHMKTHS